MFILLTFTNLKTGERIEIRIKKWHPTKLFSSVNYDKIFDSNHLILAKIAAKHQPTIRKTDSMPCL